MGVVLVTAVNALFPIILLILLGYVLKRIGFLTKEFLKVGNKLVFNACLPCMLFINIYDKMNSFADIPWSIALYCVAVVLVIFCLGLVTALLTTKKKNRRGVLLQCTFRSNFAIIGLTLVQNLNGDVAVAGIVAAFTIPMFNILAVIALTVFSEKEEERELLQGVERPRKNPVVNVLKGIVKNPLIIGVVTGLVFVGVREIERAVFGYVPFRFDNQLKFLHTCATYLKQMATPLALVVLGGQFEFSAVKGMTKEIIVGCVWRAVLAPLIGIGCAALLSALCPDFFYVESSVYPTLVALFATPVAVASAIMAGQMGGDEQLATQLVVWTSLLSIVSIFVIVCILMGCGLIVT